MNLVFQKALPIMLLLIWLPRAAQWFEDFGPIVKRKGGQWALLPGTRSLPAAESRRHREEPCPPCSDPCLAERCGSLDPIELAPISELLPRT
jgi:hypothetical protein